MANYSLVINSQFKPFSYSEMLAPVMQSTQAQQAVEDAYSELETKANIWDGMLNKDLDTDAYALYQNYANELRAQADLLAREGLTPAARQSMNRMRARYAKEIVPIELAYRTREADIQSQMNNNDNDMLYSRRASQISLNEYMNGKRPEISKYSGKELAAGVAQATTNLKQSVRSYGRGKNIDNYTYTFLVDRGFKPEEIQRFISNPKDPNNSAVLKGIVDSVMQSSGIGTDDNPGWADDATRARAYQYAYRGLWQAVGQTEVKPLEAFAPRAILNANLQDRNNERQFQRQAALKKKEADQQKQQALLADVKYGNLYTVHKNDVFNNLKKAGYFATNNGRTFATKKSKDEYVALQRFARNNNISFRQAIELGTMTNAQASAWINKNVKAKDRSKFLEAFTNTNQGGALAGDYGISRAGSLRNAALYAKTLDQLNSSNKKIPSYGTGDNRGYSYQPYNIGQLFTQGAPSTTINAQTEWRYDVSGTDSDAALRQLVRDAGTKRGFKVAEFNASTGKYENVSDFDKGALTDKDYEVLSYRISPAGMLAEIRGKGDKASEHFYIRLPENAQSTKAMQKILNNDKVYSNIYGNSPESRQWAEVLHSAGISDLYNTLANMYRENQASPQKFESAGIPLFPWQQ